ncbi:serine/threonine protein kinase [Corallococcus macrosporus]|uniref:Serine/threonine protein kinase n=1 Tax=Corallococcus macrosporus TaxID=35 RepID=A0ABS3D9S7_9BACT|nr:serine/threonine-protein kinase [Corallococcus macrosporus]MBN8228423.1 serine/threonine protein kinase [Corallococcus macrosporus]
MGPPRTERFGRFELLERIWISGLTLLHRALDTAAPAGSGPVVLKRLLPSLLEDRKIVEKFLDLASLSACVQHDNVARVLDFGEVEGEPFLVREWVEGRDLGAVQTLSRRRGMALVSAPLAVSIAIDICHGLHPAHTRVGLLHGDLSPSNVLVGFDGAVKVYEFGFNRWMLSPEAWSRAGVMGSKLRYFAPEQLLREPVDVRSDIYVLGMLLYWLLCGELPMSGDSEMQDVKEVLEGRLVPAWKRNPSLDADLVRILDRALARSADDRYPSAEAMGQALADWLKTHAPTFSTEERKQWMSSFHPAATSR